MAIQTVNLGTAPTGAGGDTFRSTGAKINENFTNPVHAASRFVGTAAGAVMEVGAFGLGAELINLGSIASTTEAGNPNLQTGFYHADDIIGGFCAIKSQYGTLLIGGSTYNSSPPKYCYYNSVSLGGNKILNDASMHTFKTTQNTTIDSNGFIKAASPIVQLFADKITANDEAKLQEITFEKLGVGDYLVKGSLGFAQESWYVETPKDANGNVLFSVLYDTLENGDISVKTYKKKFDLETASIVADLDKPVDITTGRWIDIRLQELPQPEINHEDLVFESATPPDFQPTNLAQAVAEAFSNGTEQ